MRGTAAVRSSATKLGSQGAATPIQEGRHLLAAAARAAWSLDHPVLTSEGRRLLEARANELRRVTLPALRPVASDPDCDESTYAVYVYAQSELRHLDATLADARRISTHKCDPSIVELGDLVTLEFLEPRRERNGDGRDGSVQRFLLVHPVEGALDNLRISAASPLARALLGRAIGNVVPVAAPAGRYRVRILAATRPNGTSDQLTWTEACGDQPGAAPSWQRHAARRLIVSPSASAPRA